MSPAERQLWLDGQLPSQTQRMSGFRPGRLVVVEFCYAKRTFPQ